MYQIDQRRGVIAHPITAIAAAPINKLVSATACFQIGLLHNVVSITKSPASISTHAAYISIPADIAHIKPCVNFSWPILKYALSK